MTTKNSFEKKSYELHASWYSKLYPDSDSKKTRINIWKQTNTINAWLHRRIYEQAGFLMQDKTKWLTVGDGNGADAAYLEKKGCSVVASDISDALLPIAKQEGLIKEYAIENAENLSFNDNTYDYVLCKESFHHFPRPYTALYEMIRVAKYGVILFEPQDPVLQMPFLLRIMNIADKIQPALYTRYWKNRYSFEEVGNFVYKISVRELEKAAMGIQLPAFAIKGYNSVYSKGVEQEEAKPSSSLFRYLKRKIKKRDLLCKTGIIPFGELAVILFKEPLTEQTILKVKQNGFRYYSLPRNPYN